MIIPFPKHSHMPLTLADVFLVYVKQAISSLRFFLLCSTWWTTSFPQARSFRAPLRGGSAWSSSAPPPLPPLLPSAVRQRLQWWHSTRVRQEAAAVWAARTPRRPPAWSPPPTYQADDAASDALLANSVPATAAAAHRRTTLRRKRRKRHSMTQESWVPEPTLGRKCCSRTLSLSLFISSLSLLIFLFLSSFLYFDKRILGLMIQLCLFPFAFLFFGHGCVTALHRMEDVVFDQDRLDVLNFPKGLPDESFFSSLFFRSPYSHRNLSMFTKKSLRWRRRRRRRHGKNPHSFILTRDSFLFVPS